MAEENFEARILKRIPEKFHKTYLRLAEIKTGLNQISQQPEARNYLRFGVQIKQLGVLLDDVEEGLDNLEHGVDSRVPLAEIENRFKDLKSYFYE